MGGECLFLVGVGVWVLICESSMGLGMGRVFILRRSEVRRRLRETGFGLRSFMGLPFETGFEFEEIGLGWRDLALVCYWMDC